MVIKGGPKALWDRFRYCSLFSFQSAHKIEKHHKVKAASISYSTTYQIYHDFAPQILLCGTHPDDVRRPCGSHSRCGGHFEPPTTGQPQDGGKEDETFLQLVQ
jgi:hypothetical protein